MTEIAQYNIIDFVTFTRECTYRDMDELNRDDNYKQMWNEEGHHPSETLLPHQTQVSIDENQHLCGDGSDSGMSSICDSQLQSQIRQEGPFSFTTNKIPKRGYIGMVMMEHRERRQHMMTLNQMEPSVQGNENSGDVVPDMRPPSPTLSCTSDYGSNITSQDLNNASELSENFTHGSGVDNSKTTEPSFIVINSTEKTHNRIDSLSEAANCKAFTTFHGDVV